MPQVVAGKSTVDFLGSCEPAVYMVQDLGSFPPDFLVSLKLLWSL